MNTIKANAKAVLLTVRMLVATLKCTILEAIAMLCLEKTESM